MNFSFLLYFPLTLPVLSSTPLPSVPPSPLNKLHLHLPQCCSRLFGRPRGPVAQRRRLNAAHRTHWLHCAFDEALRLSHLRSLRVRLFACVHVADCEGTSVCPHRGCKRPILCAHQHLSSYICLPGADTAVWRYLLMPVVIMC